jgi:hypothetical protein
MGKVLRLCVASGVRTFVIGLIACYCCKIMETTSSRNEWNKKLQMTLCAFLEVCRNIRSKVIEQNIQIQKKIYK